MSASLSVIVPMYNSEKTIARALDSVLSQGDANIEILVIDDCSSDSGPDLVHSRYVASGMGTVRLLRQERNGGPSVARNRGMREAEGEWLALLDADDVWLAGRLRHSKPYFDRSDVVADEVVGFDVGANCFTGTVVEISEPGDLTLFQLAVKKRAGEDFDSGFLKPFFRKTFVDQHGLAYDDRLRQGEDWLFYLECAVVGARIQLVDFPGYGYSTWVGEVSGVPSATSHTRPDGGALADALVQLIEKHADILSLSDRSVLEAAAAQVRYEAGAWGFHYAVLQRDFVGIMSALLQSASAREAAISKARDRLFGLAKR